MEHLANKSNENRQLKSLKWVSERWGCSRQTCRRVLRRHGILPFFLGGGARNATLRFDLQQVLKVEAESRGEGCSLGSSFRGRGRGERCLDDQAPIPAPDSLAVAGKDGTGETL